MTLDAENWIFLDLINDSLDEDINTFLIVVSVLLTVSKLSVVEVLEVVFVAIFDVTLAVEFEMVTLVLPSGARLLTSDNLTVSPVSVLIGVRVTETLLVKLLVSVLLEFNVTLIFLSGSWTVLTQLSISGLNLMSPL